MMITEPFNITEQDVRTLERCDIIWFKGISGEFTTVSVAKKAPQIVLAYSSAGQVFDVAVAGKLFTLTPKG
jgi:hypothetical protein